MLSHFNLCPTLCDPLDCSPPGSTVHSIFQARILEWVAISFPTHASSLCLLQILHCRQILDHWATEEAQNSHSPTINSEHHQLEVQGYQNNSLSWLELALEEWLSSLRYTTVTWRACQSTYCWYYQNVTGRKEAQLLKEWQSPRTQHKPIRIKPRWLTRLDLDPQSASEMTPRGVMTVPRQCQKTRVSGDPNPGILHPFPKLVRIILPLISIWNYPAYKN